MCYFIGYLTFVTSNNFFFFFLKSLKEKTTQKIYITVKGNNWIQKIYFWQKQTTTQVNWLLWLTVSVFNIIIFQQKKETSLNQTLSD